ncbi:hypothetical protein STZ1_20327 [Bacillus subtilis]
MEIVSNSHPEESSIEALPSFMKNTLCRKHVKEQLDKRLKRFLDKINNQMLSLSKSPDEYQITITGDWHRNGCTCILSNKKNNEKFLIKQRSSKAEGLLKETFLRLNKDLGYNIYIPDYRDREGFFTQVYVERKIIKESLNETLGALLAVSFWYGLFDLHIENIIPTDSGIAIVDGECLFGTRRGITFLERLSNSGLFYPSEGVKHISSAYMLIKKIDEQKILSGWKNTINWLVENIEHNNYKEFDVIPIRKLMLHTFIYTEFLRNRYFYNWSHELTREKWKKLNKSRPVDIVEYELEELQDWYIPYFYQEGNELYTQSRKESIGKVTLPSESYKRFHKKMLKKELYTNKSVIKPYLKKVSYYF